jgi:hypothetical protein
VFPSIRPAPPDKNHMGRQTWLTPLAILTVRSLVEIGEFIQPCSCYVFIKFRIALNICSHWRFEITVLASYYTDILCC